MSFVWERIQVTDGTPSERILIIARNMRYIEEWCRIHAINPRSPMVKFVIKSWQLRGISGCYYVDLGTDDQELRRLLERLKTMDRIKPLLTPNI